MAIKQLLMDDPLSVPSARHVPLRLCSLEEALQQAVCGHRRFQGARAVAGGWVGAPY